MSGALAVALYVGAMLAAGADHADPVRPVMELVAAAPAVALDGRVAQASARGSDRGAASSTDPVRPVMEAATAVGSGYGLAAVLGLTALADPDAALAGAQALVGAGLVTLAHKTVLGRARPFARAGPYALTGPSVDDSRQSLPSGHSSAATAVFGALAQAYPRHAPALEAAGILVGLSRVYLGWHWPSDVLAGRGLGAWWSGAAAGAPPTAR